MTPQVKSAILNKHLPAKIPLHTKRRTIDSYHTYPTATRIVTNSSATVG